MRNKGNIGLIVIIAVAIVVVAIGGYFLYQRQLAVKPKPTENVGQSLQAPQTPVDEQVRELRQVNSSDEVSVIEQDLNNTNLENLDQDLGQVDASLSEL